MSVSLLIIPFYCRGSASHVCCRFFYSVFRFCCISLSTVSSLFVPISSRLPAPLVSSVLSSPPLESLYRYFSSIYPYTHADLKTTQRNSPSDPTLANFSFSATPIRRFLTHSPPALPVGESSRRWRFDPPFVSYALPSPSSSLRFLFPVCSPFS